MFTLRPSDPFVELVGVDPPIAADAKRAWNLALLQQAIDGRRMTVEILSDFIHRHHWPNCHFCEHRLWRIHDGTHCHNRLLLMTGFNSAFAIGVAMPLPGGRLNMKLWLGPRVAPLPKDRAR